MKNLEVGVAVVMTAVAFAVTGVRSRMQASPDRPGQAGWRWMAASTLCRPLAARAGLVVAAAAASVGLDMRRSAEREEGSFAWDMRVGWQP